MHPPQVVADLVLPQREEVLAAVRGEGRPCRVHRRIEAAHLGQAGEALHPRVYQQPVGGAGAVAALRSGKSLLPAGVIRVDGMFARGDAVVIRGPDGAEVGRGLIAYDAEDAARIKGRSSADILSILGFGGRTEMVHRDNLVVG